MATLTVFNYSADECFETRPTSYTESPYLYSLSEDPMKVPTWISFIVRTLAQSTPLALYPLLRTLTLPVPVRVGG